MTTKDQKPERPVTPHARGAQIAQVRALEAELLAMADEARAAIAQLDAITLPAPH